MIKQTNTNQYAIDQCLPTCASWEEVEKTSPGQTKLGNMGLNEVKRGSSYRTSQGLDYVNEHQHSPKENVIQLMYFMVAVCCSGTAPS